MNEKEKKAFEFAADAAKQLLTLATSIVALTITFLKDILKGDGEDITDCEKLILKLSWIAYCISICGGIGTLLTLTGVLRNSQAPQINEKGIKPIAAVQIIFFIIGLILTIVFGWTTF